MNKQEYLPEWFEVGHCYVIGLFGWALLTFGVLFAFENLWFLGGLTGAFIWSVITAHIDKRRN